MADMQDDLLELASFGAGFNAVVVGASGGIGSAFVDELRGCAGIGKVVQLSRKRLAGDWHFLDLEDEASIEAAAGAVKQQIGPVHLVLIATGLLHGDEIKPEKSWRAMNRASMEQVLLTNTIGPSLVAKQFLPLLAAERKSVLAAISARVGSIGDNQLGGWHAYRASKAALNMVIKTLSVELARKNPKALCVGLHPGTVDTALSEPFQRGVAEGKLFTPQVSARHMLAVLDGLGPTDSGYPYAWDGSRIEF